MIGTVKWYNIKKGYGFIGPDGQEDDIFMHATGLSDRRNLPKEGDRVEFEVQQVDGGKPGAVNIQII